ncbi:MAG: DUF1553 domain-containing protein [Verrucomicrobia bacterium]|nr:DUF1553 domain-containing protein [Verrucomicrobiota bacterium]
MNWARSCFNFFVLIGVLTGGVHFNVEGESVPKADVSAGETLWESHIEPLFKQNCFKCHGGVKQKGGLDLRTLDSVRAGGDNGPVVVEGNPNESLLFKVLQPGADPHMPPDEEKQLASRELNLVEMWIQHMNLGEAGRAALRSDRIASVSNLDTVRVLRRQARWVPYWTMPIADVINRFVRMSWKDAGNRPSRVCDDATFVRRVYLDLAGRIPSLDEATAFIESKVVEKRTELVESLLSGDAYPRHMREIFDVVLMEERGQKREGDRESNGWYEYLESSFRSNRPWDEIVRALVLARPAGAEERGALWFLYERKNNHQAMAEAVAPVAYGVQVRCAQCHNHPLASEIKQKHYWGLVAAFNRSNNVETDGGLGIEESAIGGFVKFTNLEKETQPAVLAFLDGTVIPEDRPEADEKEVDSSDKYRIPPPLEKEKPKAPARPLFSRREKLAEAVAENNPLLARAFVNRMWALLIGRGFVHPVDEMDSKHPPSHPELLDWLARDFERSGFDVKRLIRGIVLSRPYQLDSHPPTQPAAVPETFSYGLEKPLSAEVLARSILVATGDCCSPDRKIAEEREKEIRRAFEPVFPDLFPVHYNANLSQALFLSNSAVLDDLLKPRQGNTISRLIEIPDLKERIGVAFWTTFGRAPDDEEMRESVAFLDERESDPEAGIRFLMWGLLASAEFQLNH